MVGETGSMFVSPVYMWILPIVYVLFFLALVITLVKQIREKEYIWFVLTLLVAPIMIIYWVVWLINKFGGK